MRHGLVLSALVLGALLLMSFSLLSTLKPKLPPQALSSRPTSQRSVSTAGLNPELTSAGAPLPSTGGRIRATLAEGASRIAPYWNTTCPFADTLLEYSCPEDKVSRATALAWTGESLELARETLKAAKGQALNGRRVIVFGNSLAKQIYVGAACTLHHLVTNQRVEWAKTFPEEEVSGRHFHAASLHVRGSFEFHFAPLAEGARENSISRFLREYESGGGLTFGKRVSPFRGSVVLGQNDVIVLNFVVKNCFSFFLEMFDLLIKFLFRICFDFSPNFFFFYESS